MQFSAASVPKYFLLNDGGPHEFSLAVRRPAVHLHAMKPLKFLLLSCIIARAAAETIEADVVVYGGSAAGVSAACTSARLGKKAAVAEFGRHIGGLTSGGLGWTDIGNKAAIGGFSRDFYKRLG